MTPWNKPLQDAEQKMRVKLVDRISTLTDAEVHVTLDLLDQLVVCFDPEIVHDFTEWRKDPRFASVLQLLARLDDDQRDQVLFFTEDLFAAEKGVKNRS